MIVHIIAFISFLLASLYTHIATKNKIMKGINRKITRRIIMKVNKSLNIKKILEIMKTMVGNE